MTLQKISWQEQARQFLIEGKYGKAASLYEQAIVNEPNVSSHYWYLGIAYLLQGYEEEAQVAWMSAMVEGTPEEVESGTEKLVQVLEAGAQLQMSLNNLQNSWLIRQHIREIAPTLVNNLLNLIQVSIDLGNFTPGCVAEWQVPAILQQSSSEHVNPDLLLQVLKKLLIFPVPETLAFVEACLRHQTQNPGVFINPLLSAAVKLAYKAQKPEFAISLAQVCLKLNPEYPESLRQLSCFYSQAKLHQKAIETAKHFFNKCPDTFWQVQGSCLMLRALLNAGAWLEAEPVVQRHKILVKDLLENPPEIIDPSFASNIFMASFFLPYIQDRPLENRWLQNQAAQLLQRSLQTANSGLVELDGSNRQETARRLKIGYIAHTIRDHSVGWLSRWLFQHYDRETFQTNLYLLYQESEDHQWVRDKVDFVYNFDCGSQSIAAKIKEDQIDILVDLDSLTLDITCQVMALKPAPVQVTWLGWDATGIPAIDYFVADPYVLPENAQGYYQENIWRLPHTYVAVDGFEVGVPSLRRDRLEIPSDAVVYYSSQTGLKRHPDIVHLQMKILKQVPNSYFLIKGNSDEAAIQQFFTHVAKAEGVNPARLRFLPKDPNEFVHRANLGIADVVLDTYPYNGATTTLETLWVGVPLVTRVGQQFSARNSYTFMMNVGVTEGIAWTDEEYVEWGVRLGKDSALRQQVAWKLRQSRQTSPLWNGKQFTREMEKAYKQMWGEHVKNNS